MGMKKAEDLDIEKLIQAAVSAAYEAGIKTIDQKVQEAVNLGVTIGLKVGTELGAKAGAEAGAKVGAEVGATEAAKAIEREKKRIRKQQYDRRFHNTKLLLRHYRTLNEHYHHAVFDTGTAEAESESFAEIMQAMNADISDEALYIESIKQSCMRTKIIMAHVNKMLECYEIMCNRSKRKDDKRHWRILNALYISESAMTAVELAKKENIDKRTVYRDIDICISDLTALLFGVGGVENL